MDNLCIPPPAQNICLSSGNKIIEYRKDVLAQSQVPHLARLCDQAAHWVALSLPLHKTTLGVVCIALGESFVTTSKIDISYAFL